LIKELSKSSKERLWLKKVGEKSITDEELEEAGIKNLDYETFEFTPVPK